MEIQNNLQTITYKRFHFDRFAIPIFRFGFSISLSQDGRNSDNEFIIGRFQFRGTNIMICSFRQSIQWHQEFP